MSGLQPDDDDDDDDSGDDDDENDDDDDDATKTIISGSRRRSPRDFLGSRVRAPLSSNCRPSGPRCCGGRD